MRKQEEKELVTLIENYKIKINKFIILLDTKLLIKLPEIPNDWQNLKEMLKSVDNTTLF